MKVYTTHSLVDTTKTKGTHIRNDQLVKQHFFLCPKLVFIDLRQQFYEGFAYRRNLALRDRTGLNLINLKVIR